MKKQLPILIIAIGVGAFFVFEPNKVSARAFPVKQVSISQCTDGTSK
jgi:hypothetical protein